MARLILCAFILATLRNTALAYVYSMPGQENNELLTRVQQEAINYIQTRGNPENYNKAFPLVGGTKLIRFTQRFLSAGLVWNYDTLRVLQNDFATNGPELANPNYNIQPPLIKFTYHVDPVALFGLTEINKKITLKWTAAVVEGILADSSILGQDQATYIGLVVENFKGKNGKHYQQVVLVFAEK